MAAGSLRLGADSLVGPKVGSSELAQATASRTATAIRTNPCILRMCFSHDFQMESEAGCRFERIGLKEVARDWIVQFVPLPAVARWYGSGLALFNIFNDMFQEEVEVRVRFQSSQVGSQGAQLLQQLGKA